MKQTILNKISDLCSDFLFYDRKEDEELSAEQLKKAVNSGEITVDEMVAEFRKHLEVSLVIRKNKIKVDDPNAPWNWEKDRSEL